MEENYQDKYPEDIIEASKFFKLIGDPKRLALFFHLCKENELTPTEILAKVERSISFGKKKMLVRPTSQNLGNKSIISNVSLDQVNKFLN